MTVEALAAQDAAPVALAQPDAPEVVELGAVAEPDVIEAVVSGAAEGSPGAVEVGGVTAARVVDVPELWEQAWLELQA